MAHERRGGDTCASERPAPRSRRADGAGEAGQMMILAAVVLVLGLVALAALTSQVARLAQESGREQDRPILAEMHPMLQGLNQALTRLSDPAWSNVTRGTPAYDAAVRGILEHLRALEASRGFALEYSFACDNPADLATGRAYVSLGDGALWQKARSIQVQRTTCA